MQVLTQIFWCAVLWYCCFANFDAFRFRKMPMRALGLIGSLIAAWYGFEAILDLQSMMVGLAPIRNLGVEVLFSIGLAAWFHYPMDGEMARGRRVRLQRT